MKYKNFFLGFSLLLILASTFFLFRWKLKLATDFTGGVTAEYEFTKEVDKSLLEERFKVHEVNLELVSTNDNKKFLVKTSPISPETKSKIDSELESIDEGYKELKFELVGPSIGPELVRKTIYALIFSSLVILFWVAYQFKSVRYGVSAILAMLHDSLILLGSFSLLGHVKGWEVDFLFVTAMLTILSFSVHDTIVVFDRIRELSKKTAGSFCDLADKAVTQTMSRSLNNSFTIIFMLVALVLMGGASIRSFATALLIGTISGTYSSPFVAVPLLVTFDNLKNRKIKFGDIRRVLFRNKAFA